MIQLSDIKAAPGTGGLLAQKPKAGGDASAFALALGSLAADGQPGTLIAFPRQSPAATGSLLPVGEPGDAERKDGADTALAIFSLPNMPASIDPAIVSPATIPSQSMESIAVAVEDDDPERLVFDVAKDAPERHPIAIEKIVADEPMPAGPGEDMSEPVAVTAATTPPPPLIPPIVQQCSPPSSLAEPKATIAPEVRSATAIVAAPAPTGEPSEAAITLPLTPPAASPVGKAVPAPIVVNAPPSATSKPVTAPVPPAPPLTVATPLHKSPLALEIAPSALATGTITRPAVTTRFESPTIGTKPRATAPSAKPSTETIAAIPTPIPTLPTKLDVTAPIPAKFVVAEVAVDSPAKPVAPNRIAIMPVVPGSAPPPATPMTVADLIAPAHRQRTGVAPLAPIVDAASVGVSAPVEAASQIAEPAHLDTERADWIEGMIEQIDVMRDARGDGASATTRIRLSPDALGAIEIVLSGAGEAIDVRINADTAAARTLLAEAAPRLNDMAEARGLKLAQSDAGHSGERQAQRQQPQDEATANRRRATDSAATGGNSDERIA